MEFIDTHTHLYLPEFKDDIKHVMLQARTAGVNTFLLPNIDNGSIPSMMDICHNFPGCFPMLGLHPSSVRENYQEELKDIFQYYNSYNFIAVGEIGIDLYWDKTYKKEQIHAFEIQVKQAMAWDLPVVIHSRNSFDEIFEVLNPLKSNKLKGVFHCFTGSVEQAGTIIELGFKMGIGGIVTYKNAGLDRTLADIDIHHIILETDSPYLSPVPFRGKRNESAYIRSVAEKVAEIYNVSLAELAEKTTNNAKELFNLV